MVASSFYGRAGQYDNYVLEPSLHATSTSSVTIPSVFPTTVVLNVDKGKSFAEGMWMIAASSSDLTGTYIHGSVLSVDETNDAFDAVSLSVQDALGAGTHIDWVLQVSGTRGAQGGIGATGPAAWLPVVAWLTAQNFVVGPPASVVTNNGNTYVCAIAHTSGVFATDLAAGKWLLLAQAGGGVTGATADGVVYATGAAAATSTVALTDGQLVVGQTGSAPLPKTVSGDATIAASGALTIAANAVTNSKAAQMAANTIKGNNTAGVATAADLTAAQAKALLAIAAGDVSGLAAVATSGSATDLTTGTLPNARVPVPAPTLLGGVKSLVAVAHQFLTQIGTDGSVSQAQPAFTDVSGSVAATQMPALTGDVTTTAGAVATTIAAGVVTFAKMAAAAFATAANYLANTASLILTTDKVWSAAAPVALTYAATFAPDYNTFINGTMTLTGNIAFGNGTNSKAGQAGVVSFTQDGTGGHTLTLGTEYKAAGGASSLALSTAASAQDDLYYFWKTTTECHVSLNKALS